MPIYEATLHIRFEAPDAQTAQDNLILIGDAVGNANLDEHLQDEGIASTDITLGQDVTHCDWLK